MAGNSRGLARFAKRLLVVDRHLPSPSGFRRTVHASVYEKNVDEHVRPTVVPDDITEQQSDKYWAPNPKTGVFGPANEANPVECGGHWLHSNPVNADESVLEERAFFRPLENLEKPQHS